MSMAAYHFEDGQTISYTLRGMPKPREAIVLGVEVKGEDVILTLHDKGTNLTTQVEVDALSSHETIAGAPFPREGGLLTSPISLDKLNSWYRELVKKSSSVARDSVSLVNRIKAEMIARMSIEQARKLIVSAGLWALARGKDLRAFLMANMEKIDLRQFWEIFEEMRGDGARSRE